MFVLQLMIALIMNGLMHIQSNASDVSFDSKKSLSTQLSTSNKRKRSSTVNRTRQASNTIRPIVAENAPVTLAPKDHVDGCLSFIFFLDNCKNHNIERFAVDNLVHPPVLTSSQVIGLDKMLN